MIRLTIVALALIIAQGCTSVQYNGSPVSVQSVSYPEIDAIATASIGDHMVRKGTVSEVQVLRVKQTMENLPYTIPGGDYEQIGDDTDYDFFSAQGVQKAFLADPFEGLAVRKQQDGKVCVVTVFNVLSCMNGRFEKIAALSESEDNFQQTLIYSGRVGDRINISYREFTNSLARPAFNNEVEYDLGQSKTIAYKGLMLEVLSADNNEITYRLIRNFR